MNRFLNFLYKLNRIIEGQIPNQVGIKNYLLSTGSLLGLISSTPVKKLATEIPKIANTTLTPMIYDGNSKHKTLSSLLLDHNNPKEIARLLICQYGNSEYYHTMIKYLDNCPIQIQAETKKIVVEMTKFGCSLNMAIIPIGSTHNYSLNVHELPQDFISAEDKGLEQMKNHSIVALLQEQLQKRHIMLFCLNLTRKDLLKNIIIKNNSLQGAPDLGCEYLDLSKSRHVRIIFTIDGKEPLSVKNLPSIERQFSMIYYNSQNRPFIIRKIKEEIKLYESFRTNMNKEIIERVDYLKATVKYLENSYSDAKSLSKLIARLKIFGENNWTIPHIYVHKSLLADPKTIKNKFARDLLTAILTDLEKLNEKFGSDFRDVEIPYESFSPELRDILLKPGRYAQASTQEIQKASQEIGSHKFASGLVQSYVWSAGRQFSAILTVGAQKTTDVIKSTTDT